MTPPKVIDFQFTDCGKVYAILEPQKTRLGLSIEARPYLGYFEKPTRTNSNIEYPKYSTFDYCGHDIGSFWSQHDAARELFDRWVEFGMGAEIFIRSKAFIVQAEIRVPLIVKAKSGRDAEDYVRKNMREWEDMIDERSMDLFTTPFTSKEYNDPTNNLELWAEHSLLYGPGRDMCVADAIEQEKLIEKQEHAIRLMEKEYAEY